MINALALSIQFYVYLNTWSMRETWNFHEIRNAYAKQSDFSYVDSGKSTLAASSELPYVSRVCVFLCAILSTLSPIRLVLPCHINVTNDHEKATAPLKTRENEILILPRQKNIIHYTCMNVTNDTVDASSSFIVSLTLYYE